MSQSVPNPNQQTNPLAAVIAARAQQQQRRGEAATAATSVELDPVPATPSPSLVTSATPSPSDDLRAWATRCVAAADRARNAVVEMAYYGYRLRQAGNWAATGFDSEDTFRERLGVSARKWEHQYMILGQRIAHLPLESLQFLTIVKAEQLSLIHPRVWAEYAWLEEARQLDARQFRDLVEERNREARLLGSPGIAVVEPSMTLSLEMATSRCREIERKLLRLRRACQFKSQVNVLEAALIALEEQEFRGDKLREANELSRDLAALWTEMLATTESAAESTLRYEGIELPVPPLLACARRSQSLVTKLTRLLSHLKGATDVVEDHGPESSPAAATVPASAQPDRASA